MSVILHLALRHHSTLSSLCLHTVERLNFICTNVQLGCLGRRKLFSERSFFNRDHPVCAGWMGERFLQKPVVRADVAMSGKDEEGLHCSSCFVVQHLCASVTVLI